MSILKVDTINEKTTGNGVAIPGHVVQVQQYYNPFTSHTTSTSLSFVASGVAKSITPKYSNSLILIQSNVTMCYSDAWFKAKMYLNGSPMSGIGEYHHGYIDNGHNPYSGISFQGQYQATSTGALNFEIYSALGSSGTSYITHANASAAITLWEIAV
tara:strand:- start:217 stop:687 length:471 start_codon:yes stop_codon:yes gene_type:complete